jgi:hypothetical protein
MGRDEQIEEREVLESIFSDEITGLFCSQTAPPPLSIGLLFLTQLEIRYLGYCLPNIDKTRCGR